MAHTLLILFYHSGPKLQPLGETVDQIPQRLVLILMLHDALLPDSLHFMFLSIAYKSGENSSNTVCALVFQMMTHVAWLHH